MISISPDIHYRAVNPVPYLSRKVHNEQAKYIKEAEDLTEKDRAMLLAHVARTPYLQATYRARIARANDDHRATSIITVIQAYVIGQSALCTSNANFKPSYNLPSYLLERRGLGGQDDVKTRGDP